MDALRGRNILVSNLILWKKGKEKINQVYCDKF